MKARGKHAQAFGGRGGASADASSTALATMLKQARKSGQLNLNNRSLTEVPPSVWRINIDTPEEAKHIVLVDHSDDRWWEQVDLTKLILASNSLEQISDDIRLLSSLTVLDVHDNQLKSLPDTIGELQNLQRLNVSHNQLQSLPPSLFKLARLQTFHLQNNLLETIPNDIGNLEHLEDFDLSNNRLTSLPITFGYLTRITKLTVASNNLTTLPHEIGLMKNLKIIEATHNEIHTLPDDIGNLHQLECLYLRHNRLSHLPSLEFCSSLKELHVGNNCIRGLSIENLNSLPSLTFLDLRDNRLEKLPDEISLLQSLERLDLTNNSLSALPFVLGTLPNLKAIVLEGNPLKSIRRDILMRGTNELKKYLRSRIEPESEPAAEASQSSTSVFVERAGTTGIIGAGDDGIDRHKLASTRNLDYSDKKAANIPEELLSTAAACAVSVVNFSRNSLKSFPAGLIECQSLSELYLSSNKLTSLPPSIGQLEKLVVVELSNNQLSGLPDGFGTLLNLREVVIAFNRFTSLPPPIFRLTRLEILMANDNQISEIDAQRFCQLPMLATLNLQNNNISTVPPQLGNCTQLQTLLLEGNPCRQPRPAILTKGTAAILEYLRGRIPAE